MGLVAIANVPLQYVFQGSQAPYEPLTVVRDNTWLFSAGRSVYELTSSDGTRYRMQAYSHIVDGTQTLASLDSLRQRLKLPSGWTYSVRTLQANEGVRPTDGLATVLLDEYRNTYMRIDQR